MTPEEIARLRPLRGLMLVRRYTLPETVKGIIIPETHRVDPTQSLWEVVRCGPGVEKALGFEPEPDTIVVTRGWRGVALGDGMHRIIDATQIEKVIPW